MRKRRNLAVAILIVLTAFYESGLTQGQSDHALIRRKVFGNPVIWKLTRSLTNTYWGIDLFSSPRAGASSYVMDPSGNLY